MKNTYNYLLNREQASTFLGIDEKSFDKYIRSSNNLKRFMIGSRERYTRKELMRFITENLV